MEKIPYTRALPARSDDAVVFRINDAPVPSGMWLFIQHFSCLDVDSAPDKIRVGRGRGVGITHEFEEEPAPALNVVYHSEKPLYFVPEGERVIAEFSGTTLQDHCKLVIDGYLTPKIGSRTVFKQSTPKKLEAEPKEG